MSGAALRALTSSVFAANAVAPKATGFQTGLSGMKRSITVFHWPSNITNAEKKDVQASMTLIGKSSQERIVAWQTWILTYSCLCFPALASMIRGDPSGEYQVIPLPSSFIASCKSASAELDADDTAQPIIDFPPEFPVTNARMTVEVWNCGTIYGIYGYYALVVYLMGKRVDPTSPEMITTKRPQNIIDRFHCASVAYVLTGQGRMGSVAHKSITIAWSVSDAARKIIVREFSTLFTIDDVAVQIVKLMFGMLEYSGMQPAAFIHNLISAHEWVADEIPMIRPAYDLYVESVRAYAELDVSLRPYIKLYYGDNIRIFHSKSLSDLTSIAVFWLKQHTPSMERYTAPGGEKAIRAFVLCLKRRGITVEGSAASADIVAPPAV